MLFLVGNCDFDFIVVGFLEPEWKIERKRERKVVSLRSTGGCVWRQRLSLNLGEVEEVGEEEEEGEQTYV